MKWLKANPLIAGVGGLIGLIVILILAFPVFGIHTAFIDNEVSEANPFAESGGESGLPSDATSAELAMEMNEAMEGEPAEVEAEEDEPVMENTITELASGSFEGRSHPAVGTARFISDGNQTFLRLEDDFATDNGPDLNVYLSRAGIDAPSGDFDDDFIDLGDLRGNIGSQNYELPDGVDPTDWGTVVIWCVRFAVAFGAAPIN